MTPPAPCTGSPMKAATLSAPISRIFASSQRAAVRPKSSRDLPRPVRTRTAARCARCRGSAGRPGVHAAHAAERGAGHGRAVVAVLAADDDLRCGWPRMSQ